MEVDMDTVDPREGSETENIVGHTEDGKPTPPGFGQRNDLGHPEGLRDGALRYTDPMGGFEADQYFEPVGLVSDDRLLDIYRFEAKRAYNSTSEPTQRRAETLRKYVEARGLEVPDVTEWYAAELTRGTVKEVEEEIPEFFAYAQGLEPAVMDDPDADRDREEQKMRVRFCECDLETVTDMTDAEPEGISGPDAFKDE